MGPGKVEWNACMHFRLGQKSEKTMTSTCSNERDCQASYCLGFRYGHDVSSETIEEGELY